MSEHQQGLLTKSFEGQGSQHTEEFATSNKRTELATQRKANRAKKEGRGLFPIDKEDKKVDKEAKKAAKKVAKEERLSKMSPEKLASYNSRLQARQAFKELPKEEKLAAKVAKKAIRIDKKLEREARKALKLSKLSPEKQGAYAAKKAANLAKRIAKKEANKLLTKEEKFLLRSQRKKESMERKARWAFLAENWSGSIPDKLDILIVDGNNMRGGGPKRISRDAVIRLISDVLRAGNIKVGETICFFDHEASILQEVDGIQVRFSKEDIADDVIVSFVNESYNTDKSIMVVTCDRGLALRVLAHSSQNKKVMRNKTFLSIASPSQDSKDSKDSKLFKETSNSNSSSSSSSSSSISSSSSSTSSSSSIDT